MLKRIFLIFASFLFGFIYSQNKSFIYELKFKPHITKDSTAKELFALDINQEKSMFRSLKVKESDSVFNSTKHFSFLTTSFKDFKTVSKNLKTNETKKYINNFQTLFSINIEENLTWKIENEKKQILGMTVQKATTNYGGRNWTAWFTNEIPIPDGPYVFHGLPGLILEISDLKQDFVFSIVQIKNSNGELFERDKYLEISWKQHEKLALDYYADPTREINGKNSGNAVQITKWMDEKGNEFTPNFKEMNEREQKQIRENNNPLELNHRIDYK